MTLLSLWIILSFMGVIAARTTVQFQNARNMERIFTNGPGGKCEMSSPATRSGRRNGAREVICPTNWVLNATISAGRKSLPYKKKCRYYKKTFQHLCYGSVEGRNGSATCVRTYSYYIITDVCSDSWLAWEACDNSCGGGVSKRVKFSKDINKYEKTVEYRPCNTRECPRWGDWRPRMRGNDTIPCNITTCTRKLERDCIFNGLAASPVLCAKQGYDASNERETNCSAEECIQTTTAGETEFVTSPLIFQATSQASITSNSTEESIESTPSDIQGVSATGFESNNEIWLGFAIGFLAALFLCTIALLAKKQWYRRKEGNGTRKKWDSSRTDSSREGASTPFRLERLAPHTSEEGLYSMVQNQTTQNENFYSGGSDVVNDSPLIASDACDANASDPLYSAIPAYESNMAECYPSSEFDSTDEDCLSEAISSRLPSSEIEKDEPELYPPTSEQAEEGCKSFDSDEDRDIVHTLRKQSTKNKRSSPKINGLGDVFLSDEEVGKEEHDTERKFAFSRRYSKILAQKAKKTLSWGRNEPVEAGFKWVGGRRWTASTNSDCSTQSTPQGGEWEIASGSRILPHHSSLGACSIGSTNVDGATSGYNSAIGDSTDDERSLWAKRRMTYSQTPPSNLAIGRKESTDHRRHRSLTRNSVFSTERRHHFGGIRPQVSVCDDLLKSSSDSSQMSNKRQNLGSRPYHTVRPGSQKSTPLISRQGRLIPVEDIYSSPIDAEAQNMEKSEHWEYDLPVDAVRNKSVVT